MNRKTKILLALLGFGALAYLIFKQKNMKVLFLQLVPNVGHVWEVKEVSDAYATNFLIPRKLAKRLTPQDEKKLLEENKKQEAQRRELIENRHKIVEQLNGQNFEFQAKIGENGKMFGSISEKDIIQEVRKKFKIELQKKHIVMDNWHIKKLWSENIYIKLSEDSMAKIIVTVK